MNLPEGEENTTASEKEQHPGNDIETVTPDENSHPASGEEEENDQKHNEE